MIFVTKYECLDQFNKVPMPQSINVRIKNTEPFRINCGIHGFPAGP